MSSFLTPWKENAILQVRVLGHRQAKHVTQTSRPSGRQVRPLNPNRTVSKWLHRSAPLITPDVGKGVLLLLHRESGREASAWRVTR